MESAPKDRKILCVTKFGHEICQWSDEKWGGAWYNPQGFTQPLAWMPLEPIPKDLA